MVQRALGNMWTGMPTGDEAANLGRATACYEAALRVHTEQEFPRDWANIQSSLGSLCAGPSFSWRMWTARWIGEVDGLGWIWPVLEAVFWPPCALRGES